MLPQIRKRLPAVLERVAPRTLLSCDPTAACVLTCLQDWDSKPVYVHTDSDDYYDEAQEALQEARAAAAALSDKSDGANGDTDAAGAQDQDSTDSVSSPASGGSSSAGAAGLGSLGCDEESDPDTDDADDEAAFRAADEQAISEIWHYQKTSHPLLCKFAFADVAGDVLQQGAGAGFSFDEGAVEVLQHAAEGFLVDAFDASVRCAVHAGRQKVRVEDMRLAERLADSWRTMPRDSAGVLKDPSWVTGLSPPEAGEGAT